MKLNLRWGQGSDILDASPDRNARIETGWTW